jgi:HK97 family phage prohead protease
MATPRIERKTWAIELKSKDAAGDGSTFCGEGAIFHVIDHASDIFAPGCFRDHLDFFVSNGVIRDEHEVTTGKITAAHETKSGLYFEGKISDTPAGKTQMTLVKDGVIKRTSLGSINGGEWLDGPEEVAAYWTSVGYQPSDSDLVKSAYGARLITRSKPYEISTTWLPMNEYTSVQSKSAAGLHARPTFDNHSDATLAVVEEYLERAKGLKTLRAKDGRGLSKKSRSQLSRLRDQLIDLLAATEPPATATIEDDQAFLDSFLQMGQRLRGV